MAKSLQKSEFVEVLGLIEAARQQVSRTVNATLIDLYWMIGEYVSRKIALDSWGKGTVQALSAYIQIYQPSIRGFSSQNIWRMRQFFETYRDEPKLSTLLRELPWSSNLHILTRTKLPEEREFYLRMATEQRWKVREVARQIDSQLFARMVLNPPQNSSNHERVTPKSRDLFERQLLFRVSWVASGAFRRGSSSSFDQ